MSMALGIHSDINCAGVFPSSHKISITPPLRWLASQDASWDNNCPWGSLFLLRSRYVCDLSSLIFPKNFLESPKTDSFSHRDVLPASYYFIECLSFTKPQKNSDPIKAVKAIVLPFSFRLKVVVFAQSIAIDWTFLYYFKQIM